MSYAGTQLGGQAFNHSQSSESEAEYDRLRNLARQEHAKMQSCFDRAHQAYASHDGAEAHALSEAGKQHQASAKQYNQQASDYIFRSNNAIERVPDDVIDLHGQYVEEAEEILEKRIVYARAHGQTHLHVIVGKGNHSAGHVQKIKPCVERICREQGLQFATEANAGRMFINLSGGEAVMPPESQWSGGQQYYGGQQHHGVQQQFGGQQQGQGYGYAGQPQQQPQAQYQQYAGRPQQQMEQEQEQGGKQSPFTACLKSCCSVM